MIVDWLQEDTCPDSSHVPRLPAEAKAPCFSCGDCRNWSHLLRVEKKHRRIKIKPVASLHGSLVAIKESGHFWREEMRRIL